MDDQMSWFFLCMRGFLTSKCHTWMIKCTGVFSLYKVFPVVIHEWLVVLEFFPCMRGCSTPIGRPWMIRCDVFFLCMRRFLTSKMSFMDDQMWWFFPCTRGCRSSSGPPWAWWAPEALPVLLCPGLVLGLLYPRGIYKRLPEMDSVSIRWISSLSPLWSPKIHIHRWPFQCCEKPEAQ